MHPKILTQNIHLWGCLHLSCFKIVFYETMTELDRALKRKVRVETRVWLLRWDRTRLDRLACRVLFVRFYRWSFHLFCLYRWLWSLLQIVYGIHLNNHIQAEYWNRRLWCIRGNIRMFWHVRYVKTVVKTIQETGSFIIIMTWRCFFPGRT